MGMVSTRLRLENEKSDEKWDRKKTSLWKNNWKIQETFSSKDGKNQNFYFHSTSSKSPKPLVVSLHTWSGDYSQADPIANSIRQMDWNYLHPDFRGANNSFEACLSDLVIADIDDAIDYALKNFNVDRTNIFVIGVSGGGYATVGHFFKTKHKIKMHMAWAPIVDLEAWYFQTIRSGRKYSSDIISCTSKNNSFDLNEMRRRSPLHWPVPNLKNKNLEIYAGINDGYDGSVPISHSIKMYNKLIESLNEKTNMVTNSEAIDLLSRGLPSSNKIIQDRGVFLDKKSIGVGLKIFQGGHEMLVDYSLNRLIQAVE
jgi:dipeptidyl aminopeptidase/acylaminoacyl peptidase